MIKSVNKRFFYVNIVRTVIGFVIYHGVIYSVCPKGLGIQISLTLPFDLCLYMGFLIAWRIVYSRALHDEL